MVIQLIKRIAGSKKIVIYIYNVGIGIVKTSNKAYKHNSIVSLCLIRKKGQLCIIYV